MAATNGQLHRDAEQARVHAELERLTKALALAERDRQLLGYEIHDGIVQDLTAAAMLLEGAGRQAQFPTAENQESYAGGLRLLRESIAEARRLIRGLATVELDEHGLPVALQRLVDKFRIDQGLPVSLACETDGLSLPPSVEHLLLRIAQESLFNVWKHARSTRVEVRLVARGELELAITDDGVGFDPSQVPGDRFGLEGIRARAKVLGAKLEISSAPGQGTRISVRLPLPKGTPPRSVSEGH